MAEEEVAQVPPPVVADDDEETVDEEVPLTKAERLQIARNYFPKLKVSNQYPDVWVDAAFLMAILEDDIDDYDALRAVKAELEMPVAWNSPRNVKDNLELVHRVWLTVARADIPWAAIQAHPQLCDGRKFRFNYTLVDLKQGMAPLCIVTALGGPRNFTNDSGKFPKGILQEVPWLTDNEKEVVAVPVLQNLVKYGDIDGALNKCGWKKLYNWKNLGSWLNNQENKVQNNGVVSFNWLSARCVPTHPEYTNDLTTLKKWTTAVRYEVVLALRYLRGEDFPLPKTRNLFYCNVVEYNNLQNCTLTDAQGQLPAFI